MTLSLIIFRVDDALPPRETQYVLGGLYGFKASPNNILSVSKLSLVVGVRALKVVIRLPVGSITSFDCLSRLLLRHGQPP
jgi:hypothetical protein